VCFAVAGGNVYLGHVTAADGGREREELRGKISDLRLKVDKERTNEEAESANEAT
jgi:hypothetical protein